MGTGVLIPHLRHPMVQASAIATIEHLAPGRLFVGVGRGSRAHGDGQRPLTWAFMRRFLMQVKGLLAGELVEIDGAVTQMIHPPGFAERPSTCRFLLPPTDQKESPWPGNSATASSSKAILRMSQRIYTGAGIGAGSSSKDGETPSSPRALQSARGSRSLSGYHLALRRVRQSTEMIERMPYGADWLEALERYPGSIPTPRRARSARRRRRTP